MALERTAEWREHRRQYEAAWREANPDRVRESHSRWDKANRERQNQSKIKWRAAHPGCRARDYATPHRRRSYLFHGAKSRARALGIPFTLEFSDIVWPDVCPVLGIAIDYGLKGGVRVPGSPSLDRTDPAKGYTPENVVVMSWRANEIKRNATLAEVEMLMSYMRKIGVAPNA